MLAVSLSHLRDFLENSPVESNSNQPINAGPRRREYIIICTHCHYDHIGGIEQFSLPDRSNDTASAYIVASAQGRDFVENDLPEHSICKYVGIPTPQYTVTVWAKDFERLTYPAHHPRMDMEASQLLPIGASDLGITIINTPGHTPDELAWYDHHARHLYVGDSFYEEGDEGMPILFSRDGDWLEFIPAMYKLLEFVRKENAALVEDSDNWLHVPRRVLVSCGHTTTSVDGETIIKEVVELFEDIVSGKVPVKRSLNQRHEIHDLWRRQGEDIRFSVQGPRRLCEDARKYGLARAAPSKGALSGNIGPCGLFRKLPLGF